MGMRRGEDEKSLYELFALAIHISEILWDAAKKLMAQRNYAARHDITERALSQVIHECRNLAAEATKLRGRINE